MNFTSRSRYGLKIMMDLTHFHHEPLVRRADIANRQGVPSDYLDQIMIRLRGGGLVESIRGRNGGYKLARNPADISLWDIFFSVEDAIYPTECLGEGHNCDYESGCAAQPVWGDIFSAVRAPLERMKLSEIAEKWSNEKLMCPVGGVRECRPGRSGPSIVKMKSEQPLNPASGE